MAKLIRDYTDGEEDRLQQGWDYVQAQVGVGVGQHAVRACLRLRIRVRVRVPVRARQGVLASLCVSVHLRGTEP